MSERLLGPDLNGRLAYVPAGGSLLSAAGLSVVVYASASGSTLADIQIYNGTSTPAGPVPNSTLTVNSDSFIPLFWFPVNTDTVYVEINGGTRTAVNTDYDTRIDRVSGGVNGPLMSTGIHHGGEINVNGANPAAIDISPLLGYIVDVITDPVNPTITRIETTTTLTVPLDAAAQLRTVTWFMMDATGAVIQQATRPSNTQRRTHLQLGAIRFVVTSGIIDVDQTLPVIPAQVVNQLYDLMYALGPFVVTGAVLSPNGANLQFNVSAGRVFTPSFNHFSGPSLTNDPHISDVVTQIPATMTRIVQVLSIPTVSTNLDVGNYDVNGVVTPVGGGANSSTIFRVFAVPTNDVSTQIFVQYGQTVYSSLAAAQVAIGTTNYVVNPGLSGTGALLGLIAAIRTATNLSDPAQASFHVVAKFGRP